MSEKEVLSLGRLGMCFEYFLGRLFRGSGWGVTAFCSLRAIDLSNLVGNFILIYGNNSSLLISENLPAFE
jgi:hypothetical protein